MKQASEVIPTGVSQKFCNILLRATLLCVYNATEAIKAVPGTHSG